MQRFFLVITIFMSMAFADATPVMLENRIIGDGNWGTHMAPLVTAVSNTTGPILELGCGDFSTPLLHAICSPTKRLLVSAESDAVWLENFWDLETYWHPFVQVHNLSDWDLVGNDQQLWDVVFIDHAPAKRRIVDIARLRNRATVFVVHDSEAANYYGYPKIFDTFKYRYTYTRYKKQTTLLSDCIDVAQWFAQS